MTTESQPGKIFGAKAAVVIGSVMVAGFAALSVITAREKSSRFVLESFHSPTAIGEAVVIVTPEGGWAGQFVLQRDGVAYHAKRERELRDADMFRVGSDDTGKIPLYRRWRKEGLESTFYAKLAPGNFLVISPKEAAKTP